MSLTLNHPLVSTEWLEQHLDHPDIRILDCSQVMQKNPDGTFGFVPGNKEWAAGHIPNSIFVDVAGQLSDTNHALALMMPQPQMFAETMKRLGIGDGAAVILYDNSNHAWAARVWWMLRVCGYDNAAVLDGGWNRWTQEGRPVSTEEKSYPPAREFNLQHRPNLMVGKEEVLEAIDDPATLLLHSLPQPMFTGEVVAYARAGRIKGSQNLYCELLVDQDSRCYHAPEKIRDLMNATDAMNANRVITYCGGGIAASSNALALTLLGLENVAVYDGSLSEWTADPDLPMETG